MVSNNVLITFLSFLLCLLYFFGIIKGLWVEAVFTILIVLTLGFAYAIPKSAYEDYYDNNE